MTENYIVLSHVQLVLTPWTSRSSCQAPLSMGFPGKNIRVGHRALLQGNFLTQVSHIAGRFFAI